METYHGRTVKELEAKRDEVHAEILRVLISNSTNYKAKVAKLQRERREIEGILEEVWRLERIACDPKAALSVTRADLRVGEAYHQEAKVEAVFQMHKGGGSSYYGRVRKFDATGREVSVRRCDEREFHVHRTPTAAVKCANKVAR